MTSTCCQMREALELVHENAVDWVQFPEIVEKFERVLASPCPCRRLAKLKAVVEAVQSVRFGYGGDMGNTVSGWKAVDDALDILDQEQQ